MTTTTDVVPVDNMSALDNLDEHAREVAITGMLDQARTWLAHAVETTAPAQDIANFKAFVATAAETAKRLKVSKEIQTDAEVMVRRSERALGQAIRAGQERGEIARRESNLQHSPSNMLSTPSMKPTDLASSSDLSGNGAGIYRMTDDVTDAEFEQAVERAQEEQNVSRANVVRKVEEVKSGAERQADKWDEVANLASRGYSSRQIAKRVGMSEDGLKRGAEREGITFPADRLVGRSRRLDTNRIVRESTATLEGVVSSLALINVVDIDDPEEARTWVDSLNQSIRALRKAANQIKESIS